jgi:hypothetical protein
MIAIVTYEGKPYIAEMHAGMPGNWDREWLLETGEYVLEKYVRVEKYLDTVEHAKELYPEYFI